jgi:phosphatidylcholine synthase
VLLAWLAHLYTASGLVLAFLATLAVVARDYRSAFFWLALQIVVDATDGALARAAHVAQRIPWFNGAKLDDIVDYLTYVFVPALIVWQSAIVPASWRPAVAVAMLISSAYGFNRGDAKTADHFFTGFPSYWNIVVFYLLVIGWRPPVNAGVLLLLAVMVFVPIRYIYPSRTPVWRLATNLLGVIWGVAMFAMMWQFPAVSERLVRVSLLFPAYYAVLSVIVWARNRRNAAKLDFIVK